MDKENKRDSKMWEVLNLVLPSDKEKFNYDYIDYLTRRSNKRVNRIFPEEEKKKPPKE